MQRQTVGRLGGQLLVAAGALLTFYPSTRPAVQSHEVLLATTTSTRDAGLLDSLLPLFEKQSGYTVKVIAVGSGEALELGRRGDADVVLAHAPAAERILVDSGYFVRRRLVMHNVFLIVGPPDDPAKLRGMRNAVAALRRIDSLGRRSYPAATTRARICASWSCGAVRVSPPRPASGTWSRGRAWGRRCRWPTRRKPIP